LLFYSAGHARSRQQFFCCEIRHRYQLKIAQRRLARSKFRRTIFISLSQSLRVVVGFGIDLVGNADPTCVDCGFRAFGLLRGICALICAGTIGDRPQILIERAQ